MEIKGWQKGEKNYAVLTSNKERKGEKRKNFFENKHYAAPIITMLLYPENYYTYENIQQDIGKSLWENVLKKKLLNFSEQVNSRSKRIIKQERSSNSGPKKIIQRERFNNISEPKNFKATRFYFRLDKELLFGEILAPRFFKFFKNEIIDSIEEKLKEFKFFKNGREKRRIKRIQKYLNKEQTFRSKNVHGVIESVMKYLEILDVGKEFDYEKKARIKELKECAEDIRWDSMEEMYDTYPELKEFDDEQIDQYNELIEQSHNPFDFLRELKDRLDIDKVNDKKNNNKKENSFTQRFFKKRWIKHIRYFESYEQVSFCDIFREIVKKLALEYKYKKEEVMKTDSKSITFYELSWLYYVLNDKELYREPIL